MFVVRSLCISFVRYLGLFFLSLGCSLFISVLLYSFVRYVVVRLFIIYIYVCISFVRSSVRYFLLEFVRFFVYVALFMRCFLPLVISVFRDFVLYELICYVYLYMFRSFVRSFVLDVLRSPFISLVLQLCCSVVIYLFSWFFRYLGSSFFLSLSRFDLFLC